MQRRDFIQLSTVSALWILGGCSMMEDDTTTLQGQGSNEKLNIPPLMKARYDADNIAQYDLKIQSSSHQFFKGVDTATYAMNGTYLAPTLVLKNGDEVSINFTNTLKEPTTMHGHGMHVPPNMDGTPHQIIPAGTSWSARYRVKQRACTNWYHPHYMGKTAQHVYKGLAGLIIVEDEEILNLDLPSRYGVDDIPLVLQDRFFDENKQLLYQPSRRQLMRGYVGNIPVCNGQIEPYIDLEAKLIRLRLLNGSNSTVYTLGFDNDMRFDQIATDNALLEKPLTLQRLRLSPGERAEIVLDLSGYKGKSLQLKDFEHNMLFVKLQVTLDATASNTLPSTLSTLDFYTADQAVRTRRFVLDGSMGSFSINGKQMDLNIINEEVPLDQIEIWEIENKMMVWHNFHIHATHFVLLERDGSSAKVAANEKGYKDVIAMPPNSSAKVIVKMSDYRDASVPYMYHCHFLEHEDHGMMGQFRVI